MNDAAPGGGIPLRRRLPWSFALVLLLVVAGITAFGWRGVRAAAFQATAGRLDDAAGRLANLFDESVAGLETDISRLATDSMVVRLARSGGGRDSVETLLRLHQHAGLLIAAEVVAPDGRVLARVGSPSSDAFGSTAEWPRNGPWLTPFTHYDTSVTYAGAVPIVDGPDSLGYVVEWRRLGTGGALLDLISGLIGRDARYMIGFPGGWTDLDTVRAGPNVTLEDRVTGPAELPGLGNWVGQGRQIGGGPWWVWVGFPEGYVYAHATAFVRTMAGVFLILVLLGGLLGWRISRSITKPLAALATVADTIAAGNLHTRATVEGDAELQQLASAFNRMADELAAGQQRLEERVRERTEELHAAQHQLVRRERLATLGQLASGVGHELRNPLGVMTNAVYFLQATLKDAPPKAAEYLGILRQQISLSEKIVSELLDYARVREPHRTTVAAREVVEAQIARATPPADVVITRQYPPERQLVSVDEVQTGQIVFNLLVNAVEAMEGRGTVTITIEPNGGSVRVLVADSGPGIQPEHRAQMFEPLFTTKARGIGLGLAVSRRLAEANGGRLDIASTGPTGTTFVLELPLANGGAS